MTERPVFDDRLLNRYAVEDLEQTHTELHSTLLAWLSAFDAFDDSSLVRLIAARSPAELEKWNGPGQAALASIPNLLQKLDAVQRGLEAALAAKRDLPERAQLEGLLQSALINRKALAEDAHALVARATASGGAYDDARDAATGAVERAAAKLEQLRTRSNDTARSYRELQPMVNELQGVWSELTQALAGLSRQDQRAVRQPQDARMGEAARAITRNLFRRKMRDRARAAWPMPEIAAPGNSAPERFTAALARGDFAAAHAQLAPWLSNEWPAARWASALQDAAREIAASLQLVEPPPAGAWQAMANPMRFDYVRQLRAPMPPEVTAQNYDGWFVMQIQTEEEDAFLTDIDNLVNVYVIAVNTPGGERIGYLRFGED
jgi:hypothetical protein